MTRSNSIFQPNYFLPSASLTPNFCGYLGRPCFVFPKNFTGRVPPEKGHLTQVCSTAITLGLLGNGTWRPPHNRFFILLVFSCSDNCYRNFPFLESIDSARQNIVLICSPQPGMFPQPSPYPSLAQGTSQTCVMATTILLMLQVIKSPWTGHQHCLTYSPKHLNSINAWLNKHLWHQKKGLTLYSQGIQGLAWQLWFLSWSRDKPIIPEI